MFCSSCGLELPHELTYCSRCGNNLRPVGLQLTDGLERHPGATGYITAAVVMVTLAGFFSTLFLVLSLIKRGIDLGNGGGAIAGGILLVTLLLDWSLLRMLTRILQLGPGTRKADAPKVLPEPIPQRRLEEPRVPVSSVTDHTTRTFPPEFVERSKPGQ